MIFAQIKDGQVKNTIVLEDLNLVPLFKQGFDECIRVDEMNPTPSIGWSYVDREFIPPQSEEVPEQN